ncbi:hypothetical protein CsSME_00009751 [Camellia sinensis var. sinensis]
MFTVDLLPQNCVSSLHVLKTLYWFYKRIGFKVVHKVTGSSIGNLAHLLVWGGIGTRMDANILEILLKWCTRFKSPN